MPHFTRRQPMLKKLPRHAKQVGMPAEPRQEKR